MIFRKAQTTQEWMSHILYDHVTLKIWPPSSPEVNPLVYNVWSEVNSPITITIKYLKFSYGKFQIFYCVIGEWQSV